MYVAYKASAPQIIQQIFNALTTNDIKGPQMKHTIDDCIGIEEKLPSCQQRT